MVTKIVPNQINKIILCGIPLNDFIPGTKEYYDIYQTFPADKLLVIQNDKDNHGTFSEAETFIKNINQQINIVSKPRSDHEYPYATDFRQFLN